jgi:signal transduction histidine kinase
MRYAIERKRSERRLRETLEQVEAASRAKSKFLASMSHELRTPLNAIIGFSGVLQQGYFGGLNEKQMEYMNDILDSGRHLLSLINDILDLSKIEANKMELGLAPVNVKELVKKSLAMIKEKIMIHMISLDVQVPDELALFEINADERKLKQVMFNLLSNAAKFTPDGGKISVTVDLTDSVSVMTEKDEEKGATELRPAQKLLRICVTDSGIGIAPEDQEKIFDEFYQVRGGMTDKTPGTGLGLTLCKEIIEMHGGKIWVESEGKGKGSRFSFVLPLEIGDLSVGKGVCPATDAGPERGSRAYWQ